MRPTHPEVALARIGASSDRGWLVGFRDKMVGDGAADMVQAIDRRLEELDEVTFRRNNGVKLSGSSFEARVDGAIAFYEAFLKLRHKGKAVKASRSRQMITKHGRKGAVIKTVMDADSSSGLALVARFGRLDCSYEQIILDFPGDFEAAVIDKARHNLALLAEEPASGRFEGSL